MEHQAAGTPEKHLLKDLNSWVFTPVRGVGEIDVVFLHRPPSGEDDGQPRPAEAPDVRVYGAPGLEAFQLSEVTDRGIVSTLQARNDSPYGVLLVAGQLVKGGKQNRGVNADLLVLPGREVRVPVTCVEVGRWAQGRDDRFRHAGVEPIELRHGKFERTTFARRAPKDSGHWADEAGQGEVWNHIERIYQRTTVARGSSDLLTVLDHAEPAAADPSAGRLEALESAATGACGLLVLRRGTLLALDVFGRAEWFHTVQHELCQSAIFEASLAAGRASRLDWNPSPDDLAALTDRARTTLGDLVNGEWLDGTPVADGQTRLLNHPAATGVALADDTAEVLHLLVMATQTRGAATESSFS